MKYTKKQAADVLTLAYNFASANSEQEEKVGCYIVSEKGWRTVLSKGCNSHTESALRNATRKIRYQNIEKADGCTLFITRPPQELNLILLYGIKTIIYAGDAISCDLKTELEKRNIEIVHIEDWRTDANIEEER